VDVRDRYRRGVRPALELHQAETNLANAEAAANQRREQMQRALQRIDVLAGRYPHGASRTAARLPAGLPAVPAGLPGELLRRRPDLVAGERRLAAAGCRVDAARAALYPRLSLTGSGGTASTDLEDLVDDDFRVWSLGANLLAPLLHGGALRAEVRRQEAVVAEAVAAYAGAVLSAFGEVEGALATEALLGERRAALVRAAQHARSARDLARERWQRGLTDFLAVVDGQRQSFLADSAVIALDRARLENRLDLLLALGGGYDASAQQTTP
jgi:NodT family efflux transporter outer membrane factor (OMF) lipoprotein